MPHKSLKGMFVAALFIIVGKWSRIPVVLRMKQKDFKFEASLGYVTKLPKN